MSKVGRNDPCTCGSGKKYKKCCLRKDRIERREEREEFCKEEEQQTLETPSITEVKTGVKDMPISEIRPPESPYPQVDMSLPDIPQEKQEIVEAWWDEIEPSSSGKTLMR